MKLRPLPVFFGLLIAFLLTPSCTQEQTKENLPPLPVSLSEYTKGSDWEKENLDTAGLPAGVEHLKYSGGKIWLEVFAKDNELLYVRRKIYYRPSIFGPTDLKVQTLIMLVQE